MPRYNPLRRKQIRHAHNLFTISPGHQALRVIQPEADLVIVMRAVTFDKAALLFYYLARLDHLKDVTFTDIPSLYGHVYGEYAVEMPLNPDSRGSAFHNRNLR
jgi:hypothetical protein